MLILKSDILEIDDLVDLVKDRIDTVSKELENVQNAEDEFMNFVNTQKTEFVKQVKDLREQMEGFAKQTETELTDHLNNINDKILEVNERLNSATEGVITEENLDEHLINYAKKDEVNQQLSKKANEDEFKTLSDGLDELIQNKVNEAIKSATGQLSALTEAEGFAIRLDNVDLSTMDKIDKTGFTTFTTLQILQIPIIKAAMLSLLQEVTHSKSIVYALQQTQNILS